MTITLKHLNPTGEHDPCGITICWQQSSPNGPDRLGIQGSCYFKSDGVDMNYMNSKGGWTIEAKRP